MLGGLGVRFSRGRKDFGGNVNGKDLQIDSCEGLQYLLGKAVELKMWGWDGDDGDDFMHFWPSRKLRLLSPATKWKGDIGMGAVRPSFHPSVLPSVRPSVTFRFRSRTQKL